MDKALEDFRDTIGTIPQSVKPYGHKKISNVMIFFWVVNLAATTAMTILILNDERTSVLIGTFLIILQLIITKIFETANKMYDHAMRIQLNVNDVKLHMFKDLRTVAEIVSKRKHEDLSDIVHYIHTLNENIVYDLHKYEENMRLKIILLNCIIWKSPEFTLHLEEKDLISHKFSMILESLINMPEKKIV
jgi:hypothetical protein